MLLPVVVAIFLAAFEAGGWLFLVGLVLGGGSSPKLPVGHLDVRPGW